MTAEEKINEVLDALRPAIRSDGGDIEFIDFSKADGVVSVKLLGACESCPISMRTLKEGIERRLKASVPEVSSVEAR
jgi:Fe-S cluster biogenesis protein NfuA